MKVGYGISLFCFVFAGLFGGLLYWDMQDGSFSESLLFMTILTSIMSITFLCFPGGPTVLWLPRGQKIPPGPTITVPWLSQVPKLHKRMWLTGAASSFYCNFWASAYLQGKPFFTLSSQFGTAIVYVILYFVFGRQLGIRKP